MDDEPIIANTLVNILEGKGHDALAVSHGESAIKWAKLLLADAVISDVIMPGMNGIETPSHHAVSSPVPDYSLLRTGSQR